MLFAELQSRTKGKSTYAQFEQIEAAYMVADAMTKEDAAALWQTTFGKPRRQRPVPQHPSVETLRNNISEAQFRAACRRLLRGTPLEGWIDIVNDCGRNDGRPTYENSLGFTEDHPFSERICEKPGDVQYYSKGQDGHGYNFIWEWTPFDSERVGHGYFYCIEF